MKLRFAILAVAMLAANALAQQRLVPEQSDISFISRQLGVPVDGKFRTFDVAGKLSVKGSSRDVVVPLTLSQSGGKTTAAGALRHQTPRLSHWRR